MIDGVRHTTRRGFTLVELLVTITIITILSGMSLFAMFRAQQRARITRTRTQIAKINDLLTQRWETYRARSIPARFVPPQRLGTESTQAYSRRVQRTRRQFRLLALRDLMRMEMPDRITDVRDGPTVPGLASPSIRAAYLFNWANAEALNGGSATWTTTHQSSECLYLILASMRDGESSALDFFRTDEIGDTDGDGMKEILDSLGRPIYWLRSAPGFSTTTGPDGSWGRTGVDDDGDGEIDNFTEAGWHDSDDVIISEIQSRNAKKSPDFFDLLSADPRIGDSDLQFDPFGLFPLIYSSGEDGVYDIYQADEDGSAIGRTGALPAVYRAIATQLGGNAFPNDPYTIPANSANLANVLGTPVGTGVRDNIDNHNLETRGD